MWRSDTEKRNLFRNFLEFLGKISLKNKKQLTEIICSCQKNVKLNVLFGSFKVVL